MVKQKKAWIRLIESFMAIFLLLGIILLVLGNLSEKNLEMTSIEKNNIRIFSEIQFNDSLRNEFLSVSLPIASNETSFPELLKTFLQEKMLTEEECIMKVCVVEDPCSLGNERKLETYSSEILILSNKSLYSPRKLKLFCYKNEL